MTDIHTHILPCIDDGSHSADESVLMVNELKSQGVERIVATPHFYADCDDPDSFLDKRKKSFEKLKEILPNEEIDLRLGAEIYYYSGIERTEDIRRLTIENTNLLLLEMPFEDWSLRVINEVVGLKRERGFDVILAHIDRYLSKHNIDCLLSLYREDVMFQVNADAFSDRKKRKTVFEMINDDFVSFIGSDCHGINRRPPELAGAYGYIEKKCGKKAAERLVHKSDLYLD